MCKCVERVNKHLAEHNTVLDQTSLINMKTGTVRESMMVATRKLDKKKRGGAKIMLPSYCPFCGNAGP